MFNYLLPDFQLSLQGHPKKTELTATRTDSKLQMRQYFVYPAIIELKIKNDIFPSNYNSFYIPYF